MMEFECPVCNGSLKLSDPPPKTPEQKRAFSEAWDKRFEDARS